MIRYRYCLNSDGLHRNPNGSFTGRRAGCGHIPSLDGYHTGDELTLAYEGTFDDSAFIKIDVRAGLKICDELWRTFNAPWERPSDYAGPSMSVGDVITLFLNNGVALDFACKTHGFEFIDPPPNKIMERPTNWLRSVEKLHEYLLAKSEEVELTESEEAILSGRIQ